MSKRFLQEMGRLIRARRPLLYVVTYEEERAQQLLAGLARDQRKVVFEWSATEGLRRATGGAEMSSAAKRVREPLAVLNEIVQADTRAFYILKDFHVQLNDPEIVRRLRDVATALRHSKKTVILLSPILTLPRELEKQITVVDLPLPTYAELNDLLSSKIADPGVVRPFKVSLPDPERDTLVRAALGLTLDEAESAFAQAIVRDKVLDGSDIEVILTEKKQVVRKMDLLEYCDAVEGLAGIGGMDLLKEWLHKRYLAFGEDARRYGLPQPRGILLMGVQGCGKSLAAKAIAAEWRFPLLRLDTSRIFDTGESEQSLRRALSFVDSIAPALLWIDDIDIATANSPRAASSMATFLSWLRERTAPVFVVVTASDPKETPDELLRKGRLDDVFFVDLPRARERGEIIQIQLAKVNRAPAEFGIRALAAASKGCSGAEIEQAINSALHDSFFANHEIETSDIVKSLREIVPYSTTMRESVERLRGWASGRARPVSSQQYKAAADSE